MSSVESLEIIAQRLNAYHGQLTALAQALGALRDVSDHMIAAIAIDHAAISAHVAASAAVAVVDTKSDRGEAIIDSTDAQSEAQAAHAVIARVADALETPVVEGAMVEAVADVACEAVEPTVLPVEAAVEAYTETDTVAEIGSVTMLACEPVEPAEATVEPALDASPLGAKESEADQSTEPVAAAEIDTVATQAAPPAGDAKVVNLASRRKAMLNKFPARRAMAVAASIAVTVTAGMGFHELMQTELGQRLLDLGTCDGDMLSANRDCALLAWLML